MVLDFRAAQTRTNKIISSGSTGTSAKLLVYDFAAASDGAGAINATIFPTTNIGSDVFLFVSGGVGSKGISNSFGVSVFGGDLVVSGNVTFLGSSATGVVLTNGTTPMTATWNFGNQWLQNVNKLTIGTTTDPGAGNVLLPNIGIVMARNPDNTGNVNLLYLDGANQINVGSSIASASINIAGGSHFFDIGAGAYAVISTASLVIGANANDLFSNPGNGLIRAPHVAVGNKNIAAANFTVQPGLGTGLSAIGYVSLQGTLTNSNPNNQHTYNETVRVYGLGVTIAGSGTTISTPNAAAIVDITGSNGGILYPRMTSTQRLALPSPPDGLTVYDTTSGTFFWRISGFWVPFNTGIAGKDRKAIAFINTTTQTSASPLAVCQFSWNPSEHIYSGSGIPLQLQGVLATAGAATASLALYNLTEGAYVTIGGSNLLLSTTSSTPSILQTTDLLAGNVTHWASASTEIFEARLFTSNNTIAAILGSAEIII